MRFIAANPDADQRSPRRSTQRFATRIHRRRYRARRSGSLARQATAIGTHRAARSADRRAAEQFLRKELTDLEQFVLIQIFDQSWKDHLYAMDMLKTGIGLQAFAEQDPRIAYKKEGYRYFEEMMAGVRDKVTDLIFRARIGRATPQPRSNYRETAARHEVSPTTAWPKTSAKPPTLGVHRQRNVRSRQRSAGRRRGQGQTDRPRNAESRPKRSVPLRQREEIQEMLRSERGIIRLDLSHQPAFHANLPGGSIHLFVGRQNLLTICKRRGQV